MKRTIINLILVPLFTLLPAIAFMQPVYACGNTPAEKQVFSGVDQTSSSSSSACNDNGVANAITAAVKILSLIVGVAAVIAIISSGFKYVTSGGDSGKVGNAKNTLIYALVGIVVAVLAQVIVHFVVSTSSTVTCPSGQHLNSKNKCVKN